MARTWMKVLTAEIEPHTEYYPRYVGWYLTNSLDQMMEWKASAEAGYGKPSTEALLSAERMGHNALPVTHPRKLYVMRILEENAWGPECP